MAMVMAMVMAKGIVFYCGIERTVVQIWDHLFRYQVRDLRIALNMKIKD